MSDLRSRIIRAAYVNPDLQPHLLPLLREAAATVPMRLERERVEKEVLSLSDYLDNPNEAWVASGRDRKVYLNQVAKVIGLIAAKAGFKTQATLHSDQVDITVSKDDKSAMLRVGLYFRYDSPGYTGGKHIGYLKGVAKDSNGKYQDVEEYDLRSYGIPSLLAKIVRGR